MAVMSKVTMDEYASFKYLKWNDMYKTEAAFQTSIPIPPHAPDQRRHNLEFCQGGKELVRDLRSCDEDPRLDTHGFEYFSHRSCLSGEMFYGPQNIRTMYLPETAAFLQNNVEGADHIIVFDWRLRHSTMAKSAGVNLDYMYSGKLKREGPAPIVHVDYTDAGTLRRLEMHVGKDTWKLLRGRLQIINMWRPINGPFIDCPLAFSDGRTYDKDMLIPMNTVRPDFRCDEPVLFKNFDSDENVTPFAPHSTFRHTNMSQPVKPRESIEIWALVFTCPDGGKSIRYVIKED